MKVSSAAFAALGLIAAIGACSPLTPTFKPGQVQAQKQQPQALQASVQLQDRYLCVIEPRNEEQSIIKVMDLNSRLVRTVSLPGRVMSLDGNQAANHLYLSVRSGAENPRYTLYELDVSTLNLSRPVSFSQAGLTPIDFKVKADQLYLSASRQGKGVLVNYPLSTGGWKYLSTNLEAGQLEWSQRPDLIYNLVFGDDEITRTSINVKTQQIVARQTFSHGIPFGNNLGLVAPKGEFFYAFHQLQGQIYLYAFDIESNAVARQIAVEQAVGILYSSVISQDGRFLYATIDNRIERFELQGTSLRKLEPIPLPYKEARHLTLSQDQRTLYVSHEQEGVLSRVKLFPDQTYQVDKLAFPGQNKELIVF